MNVFAFSHFGRFAVLQSSLHCVWTLKYCSTMGVTIRYTRTDVFDTFPFPHFECLSDIGEKYHSLRRNIMADRQEGLTDTYNRFHEGGKNSEDIARLRALQVEMDQAVAAAYGWRDLDLGHRFYETKQGIRYTICEGARREFPNRLLALRKR
jgi:hypothetical protein